MENDKKHIGDLYQKAFQDAGWDDPEDEQDWNAIAYQLDKKRFFRFSFTRFNIYYSGLIVLSFLLMLFLFVRHVVIEEDANSGKILPVISDSLNSGSINNSSGQNADHSASGNSGSSENSISSNPDNGNTTPKNTILSGTSLDNGTTNSLIKTTREEKNNRKRTSNDLLVNNTLATAATADTTSLGTTSQTKASVADTSNQGKENPVVVKPPVQKKPKKIVYITKQDTITLVDTLRSKKLPKQQK